MNTFGLLKPVSVFWLTLPGGVQVPIVLPPGMVQDLVQDLVQPVVRLNSTYLATHDED